MNSGRRRSQRTNPSLQLELIWTQTRKPSYCCVCKTAFDLPTLSVKRGPNQAHVFCAILDQVGLRSWVRRAGR